MLRSILIVLTLTGSVLAEPSQTVRGPNNEIIGRVYTNGNTQTYYGRYNQKIGSSRTNPGVTTYFNQNGKIVGRVYGRNK